jgi:TP53 regulating kinase-like protein
LPGKAVERKGAEAVVFDCVFLGKPAVCKRRLPKRYRLRQIDSKLRSARTIAEASILSDAKRAGVRCPLVYYVDLQRCDIIEQKLSGTLLSRLSEHKRETRAKEAGALLGKLHAAGIYHGDFTTTNLMLCKGGLQVIDFGLSEHSYKAEDHATDALLYKKSVGAKEFEAFASGYAKENPKARQVFGSLREIESRGRYVARQQ